MNCFFSRCVLWLAAAGLAGSLCGCGDETFESSCQDLPLYDIRAADEDDGAVSGDGIVSSSPLDSKQQQALRQAFADGCITLPRFRPTLDDSPGGGAPKNNSSPSGADAGSD